MRTALFLLFYLCLTLGLFAQKESNTSSQKSAITMSAAVFPYKVGIQPGVQFKLGKRLDFITECAFTLTGRGNNQYDETHFFKLAGELKCYSKQSVGRYFSLQTGYISRKFQAKDSGWFWKKDSSDASGYSSALINSPVIFAAIKCGKEIKVGDKFFLDFLLGVGARYICTTYNAQDVHSIGRLGGEQDNIFELAGYSWQHEENEVKFHGTAGVRVGMRF